MGKGLVILGIILIVVGLLPIIATVAAIAALDQILPYFTMLGIYQTVIAGYVFTETMLALIGLGVILFLVGLFK